MISHRHSLQIGLRLSFFIVLLRLHGGVGAARAATTAEILSGEVLHAPDAVAAVHSNTDALWTPSGIKELLAAVRGSVNDGLDPFDYHAASLIAMDGRGLTDTPLRLRYEKLLTDALLTLCEHLYYGKVEPQSIYADWNFNRVRVQSDPALLVRASIRNGTIGRLIRSLTPSHAFYQGLRDALAEHLRIATAGGWPPLDASVRLQRGMRDRKVAALRTRVQTGTDLQTISDPEYFDSTLEYALMDYQRRHGLQPDGIAGRATWASLNVSIRSRIDQLRVALERSRWLIRDLPPRFVVVNVAAFQVYYAANGKILWSNPVVVGQPYTKTPIFRADMTKVILNPAWHIPQSIVNREILPASARDPQYMQRLGIVRRGNRYVQLPGKANPLGRIKLVFPNPYSVYLHDTPSRALFAAITRTFSHGCVRVRDPFTLAALAMDDADWPADALAAEAARGATRVFSLAKTLPVFVQYWTAGVDAEGKIYFLPDAYQRDNAVLQALLVPLTRLRLRPLPVVE